MAFNIELLFVVHEDMEIRNPTVSECGRFDVLPSSYGFAQLADGAWQLRDGTDVLQLIGTTYSRINAAGEVLATADLSEIDFAD
jgi:hypothetical protein